MTSASKNGTKVTVKNTKKASSPKPKPVSLEKSNEVEKKEAVKAPKGYFFAEAGMYYAHKKCYFGIAIYPIGRPYAAQDGEIIPHHFKKEQPIIEKFEK